MRFRLRGRSRVVLAGFLACSCGALACHTIREELPTQTTATPAPLVPIVPIPASPTLPTPRPSATAPPPDQEPLPAPSGGTGGGAGSCGDPTPGPLSRIEVKVHIVGPSRTILDASPLVGPDDAYCKKIGFTDGRKFCPPRPEGNPERAACDAALIGQASDTHRVGPTWKVDGKPCVFGNGCENDPDNQFLAFAYVSATYQACGSSGVCGALAVVR
jgi:hypothetical protein